VYCGSSSVRIPAIEGAYSQREGKVVRLLAWFKYKLFGSHTAECELAFSDLRPGAWDRLLNGPR
jgi:hypothetical protein